MFNNLQGFFKKESKFRRFNYCFHLYLLIYTNFNFFYKEKLFCRLHSFNRLLFLNRYILLQRVSKCFKRDRIRKVEFILYSILRASDKLHADPNRLKRSAESARQKMDVMYVSLSSKVRENIYLYILPLVVTVCSKKDRIHPK